MEGFLLVRFVLVRNNPVADKEQHRIVPNPIIISKISGNLFIELHSFGNCDTKQTHGLLDNSGG